MSAAGVVPVLLYHSVARGATPEQRGWVTAPEVFAEHMAYLAERGYRSLTVPEYASLLTAPITEAPESTVLVTFDDGFADFTEYALPVLEHHRLSATMYVVTGCVGNTSCWLDPIGEGQRPMLGWSDLQALPAAGVEVGAHTHSHPQLDTIGRGAAWDEIRRSRGVLEDRLGQLVRSFAYPFGFHGAHVRALVERAGFSSACAVKDAMSGPGDDPFAIARVIVPGDTGVSTLADLLAGRGRPQVLERRTDLDEGIPGRPPGGRPSPPVAGELRTAARGWEDWCGRCGATTAHARTMRSMEAERAVPGTTRQARQARQRRAAARRARRLRRGVVGAVLLVALAAVAVFAAQSPGGNGTDASNKGALLLREDFHGTSLDSEYWSPCYWWATDGCTNLSNNELEWYIPEQVKVSGGILTLEARRQQVTGIEGREFDYVSGLISNLTPRDTLFSFKYGYVESRVRIPEGQGLWPALWMLPVGRSSLPEVDIFEIVGERPDVVTMHTHWMEDGRERQRGAKWKGPNFAAGWHTFGLQWEPDALTWYVDGEERWRITTTEQIPQESMYLVANLAVGGDYTETPTKDTKFPAALEIDYIKVWGAPGEGG